MTTYNIVWNVDYQILVETGRVTHITKYDQIVSFVSRFICLITITYTPRLGRALVGLHNSSKIPQPESSGKKQPPVPGNSHL